MTAARVQGVFYVATGLWPIVHSRSFEAVTGPKVDKWLVKTIGGVIAAVGAALLVGGTTRANRVLGVATAAALGASDLIYSLRGRISKVYLADAAAEAGVIGLWTRR
jgi:hypothetical protein